MPNRKIIQLSLRNIGEKWGQSVLALCDDGTAWEWHNGHWRPMDVWATPESSTGERPIPEAADAPAPRPQPDQIPPHRRHTETPFKRG